jgi:serine/threonine-protein kinase
MQPTIPSGTILQSRYRIVRQLGHGGFGRTYLAEDIGRFDEKCAVKEFEPQQEEALSEKSLQLFQREATILYNIDHPQIPKFQAIFEEDQRLFLVQDYVDGTTYRELLNQRIAQGMAFSEAEVRQFLQQMLPVLAHIHSKGIIHRDISPDNIIQRHSDRLPVLIDFGVVKEVFTRIQRVGAPTHATSVGKLGYAPSEQIQSGRAYPSSDLYSLAVTAMVMLTGKEPQALFDDHNLTWNWQAYTNVSPSLADVLNRAVNYRPGDRYQSVSEMAQALGAGSQTQRMTQRPAAPSQVKTVAVGRQYQPTQVTNPPPPSRPGGAGPLSPVEPESIWENPWAVFGIFAVLAILAAAGGWLVVSLLNREPQADTSPVPTIEYDPQARPTTPTVEPPPTEPPTNRPVEYSQRLRISPGEDRTVRGNLRANETINYRVRAEAGQVLQATLSGEGVLLTVLNPQGEVIEDAERIRSWQGDIQQDGEHVIQLRPVEGLESSNYELAVSLSEVLEEPPAEEETPEPAPTPEETEPTDEATPEPQPEPEPEPEPNVIEQRVQIPSGQNTAQVADRVDADRIRRYVVNVQAGQTLSATLPNVTGPVVMDVRYPSGALIPGAAGVLSWQGAIQEGGDYMVDLRSSRPAEYTLRLTAD